MVGTIIYNRHITSAGGMRAVPWGVQEGMGHGERMGIERLNWSCIHQNSQVLK